MAHARPPRRWSVLELDQLPAALGAIQPHRHRHHPTAPADQHQDLGQPRDVLLGDHPDQAPDRHRWPTRAPQPRRQLGPQGQVAALLELERGAQPGLDLADGQRDPGPGLGGGAELPSGRGAEGVALALLLEVELGSDGGGGIGQHGPASWRAGRRGCLPGPMPSVTGSQGRQGAAVTVCAGKVPAG